MSDAKSQIADVKKPTNCKKDLIAVGSSCC